MDPKIERCATGEEREKENEGRGEKMLEVDNMCGNPTCEREEKNESNRGERTHTLGEDTMTGENNEDPNKNTNVRVMRSDSHGSKAKTARSNENKRLFLYSSSSSSSSWMTGAAERPPGSCLREVLPSIVSPKVSVSCRGCPPPDAGPFPRFPVFGH